jgi:hypothetical protein
MSEIDQEARKTDLRNSYLVSMFQVILDGAHSYLPFTVTVEQEKEFREKLAKRVQKAKEGADKFVQEYV